MEHSNKTKTGELSSPTFSITPSPLKNRPHNAYTKDEKSMTDSKGHTEMNMSHRFHHTDLQLFKIRCKEQKIKELPDMFKILSVVSLGQSPSLEHLDAIEFPVLSYSIQTLIKFSKMIVENCPQRKKVIGSFNFTKLVTLVAEGYRSNSYHNFSHSFSVLLMLFQACNRSEALKSITKKKTWTFIYIAALAHDIGHPGTNNSFEVRRKSKWANECENQAVLEQYHISQLWYILKNNSQVNFLLGLSSIDALEVKKLITRMILATDIARHQKGLNYLKQINSSKKLLEGERGLLVLEQVFHACDIGNPCLDFQNYINWGVLVCYEFNHIAEWEEKLGMEVTSYLKYQGMNKFYQGQKGFCQNLTLPLWKELDVLLPGLAVFKQNIERNIKILNERVSQLKEN